MLHLIERMLNLDAEIDNQQYSKLKDFPLVIRNPSTLPRGRNIESDPDAVGVIRARCTQLAFMKPMNIKKLEETGQKMIRYAFVWILMLSVHQT